MSLADVSQRLINEVNENMEKRAFTLYSPMSMGSKYMTPEYVAGALANQNCVLGLPVFIPVSEVYLFAANVLEEWGRPVEEQFVAIMAGFAVAFLGNSTDMSETFLRQNRIYLERFCLDNDISMGVFTAETLLTAEHAVNIATMQALEDMLNWDLCTDPPTKFAFQVFNHEVSARRWLYKYQELKAQL